MPSLSSINGSPVIVSPDNEADINLLNENGFQTLKFTPALLGSPIELPTNLHFYFSFEYILENLSTQDSLSMDIIVSATDTNGDFIIEQIVENVTIDITNYTDGDCVKVSVPINDTYNTVNQIQIDKGFPSGKIRGDTDYTINIHEVYFCDANGDITKPRVVEEAPS